MVLCYVLGLLAGRFGSDLRIPKALYDSITIYLLFAIGFKGGVEIAKTGIGNLVVPGIFSILLGILIPLYCYPLLRLVGKLSREDSASIAAHYGSVSAVTFAAALTVLETLHIPYDHFMNALLALMESPAIMVGVILAGRARHLEQNGESARIDWRFFLHEALLSKSVVLLVGGLVIGALSGENGMKATEAFLVAPFKGVLSFFLLELGVITSERLADVKKVGRFLAFFGIGQPIINGIVGITTGWLVGLTLGGATLLGVLAASASYIAAPAAMRVAVPNANPSLSLTAVLGITFPFNITLGIPLYLAIARWLFG
jgi:hypothetical protein